MTASIVPIEITIEWIMAEEISIIHEHALFFDEILDCIPSSLYLQPVEEDDTRWKKHFKVWRIVPVLTG